MTNGQALLIRGGRVVDPIADMDDQVDVLVRNGRIAAVGPSLSDPRTTSIDAGGCLVLPGLIDVHTHLRVPGQEHKETIATGTAAAAAGGFTTVCCMPNTQPALDSVEALHDLQSVCDREALVRVHAIATITKNRSGEEAVDFDALVDAGAFGFSDDGDTTANSAIMREALEASRRLRRPIMVHCEDKALARGAMHEGTVSRDLNLSGIPAEAEEIIIARDIMLTRLTGGWLHVLHVSTARGAELVRAAKLDGINVTAEVMPHHLTMTDEWVAGQRTLLHTDYEPFAPSSDQLDQNAKVNPPLRSATDTAGLLQALREGVFDIIATDHAPHAVEEKRGRRFQDAAFGMSGFEVALPVLMGLVRAGNLSWRSLVWRLSARPAQLFGLPGGTLQPGSVADLIVVDPDQRWTVSQESLQTKSPNTPLLGAELRGRVQRTFVGGEERVRV